MMAKTIDDVLDILDSEDESSSVFASALADLESLANSGNVDAAEGVAEIFAFSKLHRDPEKAYFWYHVALGQNGYATEFANEHAPGEPYCGPDGDFRNEAQVNDLVTELGEFRARQIDKLAQDWLREHHASNSG